MLETASYEPQCVKIGSVVLAVGDGKKKRKGKERKIYAYYLHSMEQFYSL